MRDGFPAAQVLVLPADAPGKTGVVRLLGALRRIGCVLQLGRHDAPFAGAAVAGLVAAPPDVGAAHADDRPGLQGPDRLVVAGPVVVRLDAAGLDVLAEGQVFPQDKAGNCLTSQTQNSSPYWVSSSVSWAT